MTLESDARRPWDNHICNKVGFGATTSVTRAKSLLASRRVGATSFEDNLMVALAAVAAMVVIFVVVVFVLEDQVLYDVLFR